MTMPLGAIAGHHRDAGVTRPEYMPVQSSAPSHVSLFRKKKKKKKHLNGRDQPVSPDLWQLEDAVSSHDSSSLTNSSIITSTRPRTAHVRRNSSVTSTVESNSTLRRRSRSLRDSSNRDSQGSKVAPTTSTRDGSRPSTAMADYRASFVPNNTLVLQRIQDTATKRVSTLDYLKKAHEGRTYWFNTIYFNKSDLSKLPYFDQQKLGRRAANFFVLGNSIPAVLDPNANNLIEFLRLMNALFVEFESYQTYHPLDGSTSSAMPRVRMGQVFRRVTSGPSKSGRRASDLGSSNSTAVGDSPDNLSVSTPTSHTPFPGSDRELLPGEDYSHLLTPSLPFEPDYFETFATLCDVLIDCYTTVLGLVNAPEDVGLGAAELFTKVDSKVKKLLITGMVKDFENASRQGARSEMAGVGKVVLSGLM